MAAGNRSLLAFWIGGASSSIQQTAGVRSLLAPWIGGAASPLAVVDQAGIRSLFAFWMGGAAGTAGVVEPPTYLPPSGARHSTRLRVPPALDALYRQRLLEDEDLIAAVLIAAIPGLMRRH